MSLIDSHAELRNRATTYKISEDTFKSLQREGIESLANLAFALGSNPGVIQEDDFQKFITTLGVTDPQEILALRRLTFEAQTMLIFSLKQEVSRPSASSSEIAFRAKTAGVTIKGEYEPSHVMRAFL